MKRYLVFFFIILFAALVGMKLYFIYSKVDIKPNVDLNWNSGQLVHLLPTVNHNRILIKASFQIALAQAPSLKVNGKGYPGQRTDTQGYFWCFDATGLEPNRRYDLVIQDALGKPL